MVTGVAVLLLLTISTKTGQTEDCPPWFKRLNTTWENITVTYCACISTTSKHVKCEQEQQQSYLRQASCVFYNYSSSNEVVAADCPFLFPNIKKEFISLPNKVSELNTFVCGKLNREVKGPLCGKCINDTGPSLYSIGNECVRCSAVNVVYYLLLQYLPITLMVIMVIVFRPNITAAPMAHYVIFCNVVVIFFKFDVSYFLSLVTCTSNTFNILIKFALTLCAVWTFDLLFFVSPPLCISPHMEDIYTPFTDFLTTLYPFILLLLTYIGTELHARDFKPIVVLWRPFHKMYVKFYTTWNPNTSMIQAFSSLFFLSYAKLLFLISEPYLSSVVANAEGKVREQWILYIDPTFPFGSKEHLYIISFSAFIAIFLFLPPFILLIIYPTSLYKKLSVRLKPRWKIAIKSYVETFQGCYKDGTNGTRDYRALSGYVLALVVLLLSIEKIIALLLTSVGASITSANNTTFQINIFLFATITIIILAIQPYKQKIANMSAVAALVLLGVLLITLSSSLVDENDITRSLFLILLSSPHCALAGYVIWKIKGRLNIRLGNVPLIQ